MIKLSENIKKYRRQKDMTQEQLASILGVSVQAVSRWENASTYPDISLLPAIASYFDVSLDELMGMEAYKDEKEIEKIYEQVKENARDGLISENVALLKDAAKRYPRNYELLSRLVHELTFEYTSDEHEKQNLSQALDIIDRILEECTDMQICNSMIGQKIFALRRLGRMEQAIELAEKCPSIWDSYNYKLLNVYSGEKLKEHCGYTIVQFCTALGTAIIRLSDLDFQDSSFNIRDRINVVKKAIEVYELVFEGNYVYNSREMSQFNRYIAAMEVLEGNFDATLDYLERAAEYAIKFDTLPDKVPYTSVLLKSHSYDKEEVYKNYTWSECAEFHEKLKQERYDSIREDVRFKNIEEKIKKYI